MFYCLFFVFIGGVFGQNSFPNDNTPWIPPNIIATILFLVTVSNIVIIYTLYTDRKRRPIYMFDDNIQNILPLPEVSV